jgi:SAM-dependent methyltransferase
MVRDKNQDRKDNSNIPSNGKSPAAYYDDSQFDYRDYWKGREYEHLSEKMALEKLFKEIGKDKLARANVLEIGAGFGRVSKFYLNKVKRAFLLEPSEKLIKQGEEYLKNCTNYTYIKTDTSGIANLNEKFDLVIMVRVLHHIDDSNRLFRDISRSLFPQGYFILEVPNKKNFKYIVSNILRLNLSALFDDSRMDIRSREKKNNKFISFYNYSYSQIAQELKSNNFKIVKKLSVSNFRLRSLKRLLPLPILLKIESSMQIILSRFNFAPSLFVLARRIPSSLLDG